MSMFFKQFIQYKFFRFLGVGLFGFLMSLGLLVFLTESVGAHYLIATAIVFMAVNFLTFLLQQRFTFVTWRGLFMPGLMRYYGVMGLSLLGNLLGMYILVGRAGMSVIFASVILSVLFLLLNFVLHDSFTFRTK